MHDANTLIRIILDSCIRIHTETGPGLLESVYEDFLCYELAQRGLHFTRQQILPVRYHGVYVEHALKADIIVEGMVIVEIKSVDAIAPVHFKQLHTYLKVTGIEHGILVNFNVDLLKDGFHRRFNNFKP